MSPGDAFASIYERFADWQDRRGLVDQRRRVGESVEGVVLEVGIGTGRNLAHYGDVTKVVGVDPHPRMLRRALGRSDSLGFPVELIEASAESLPFPSDSFDSVAVTLALCTIPRPRAALAEVRRVLKPGGRFVFLEHERSPVGAVGLLQDVVTPAWMWVAQGCHLNRPTVDTLQSEGFELVHLWRSRDGRGSMVQGTAVAARR